MNPLGEVNLQDPAQTVANLQSAAKGASQLIGYAVGLTEQDVNNLYYGKVPLWAIVLGSTALGIVAWSRFAPEHWIGRVRTFGK